MFTVALIGPDGAGKTTIARRLVGELDLPVKYIYMGVNPDSSSHLLPTTRLIRAIRHSRGIAVDTGTPDIRVKRETPRALRKRALASLKAGLGLANRLAEEWYRQCVTWFYVRRGVIVLFDRHFFSDYYAHDIAGGTTRSMSRRIHGFLLSRVYPQPDLVIYLDAPPEVLLARKGEGTLESLARRRGEYLDLARFMENFAIVNADRPLEEVSDNVQQLIRRFAGTRRVEAAPASLLE